MNIYGSDFRVEPPNQSLLQREVDTEISVEKFPTMHALVD